MKKIILYKYIFCTLLILSISVKSEAQADSSWLLKFKRHGHVFKPGKEDYMPFNKGFYLYENCVYNISLKNDMVYRAVILKIKEDSIELTTHLSEKEALEYHEKFDTLIIPPPAIKKIRLLGDRVFGLYSNVHLRKYSFEFAKDTLVKRMVTDTLTDTITSVRYLIRGYVTAQGIDPLYETLDTLKKNTANTSDTIVPVIAKQDTILHKRNFIWLLPFNASEINGIATGIHTGNLNGRALKIRGINANIDIEGMFVSMFLLPHFLDAANVKILPDTLQTSGVISVNGISISGGGIINGKKLCGAFINGGVCESNQANGIFITGGFNYFQTMKGISIAGLRNTGVRCTGIQIGFINSCKYLKGLQIGLWNVNSKRKLPFINWGI